MYYHLYEWNHALMNPARMLNDAVRLCYKNPWNPLTYTEFGRQVAASSDLFERMTRRYGKPEFGLNETDIDGEPVRVHERIVWERTFCRLIHFQRNRRAGAPRQPNLVIVAPMSGHYATLLRGTVAAMLPHFEVYITDWVDARMVPLAMGGFDLDDYIDYIKEIAQVLEGDLHMMAVCQPAVPVFAATALLEAENSPHRPKSITLMGGPIDPRESPTEVNLYAANHDLEWFRRNVIMSVPLPHPGFMRKVYPGFLQLSGFMAMNFDRHLSAHYDYFDHLVKGDGDSADKHEIFYDEYLSVMDLTEEFFLQTVESVFHRYSLPKGEMTHRQQPVEPWKITRTAVMTVEGENDDISGVGQTRAAHMLTPSLPEEKHTHYAQDSVGHYGVFNGSRYRLEIAPRIREFIHRWDDADAESAAPGRSAATKSNGHETPTPQPHAAEPDAADKDVIAPAATSPDATEPDTTEPDTTGTDATETRTTDTAATMQASPGQSEAEPEGTPATAGSAQLRTNVARVSSAPEETDAAASEDEAVAPDADGFPATEAAAPDDGAPAAATSLTPETEETPSAATGRDTQDGANNVAAAPGKASTEIAPEKPPETPTPPETSVETPSDAAGASGKADAAPADKTDPPAAPKAGAAKASSDSAACSARGKAQPANQQAKPKGGATPKQAPRSRKAAPKRSSSTTTRTKRDE